MLKPMIRRAGIVAVATLLLLTLGKLPGAKAQTGDPVRLLVVAVEPAGEAFYGKEIGIFQKHGLDVTVSTADNGGVVIAAVVGGSSDIGYTNIISLEIAHKNGVPIQAIAPAGLFDASEKPAAFVLVKKDSPLKTAADLSGKTIAMSPLKSLGEVGVDAWLDKSGGDSSKVKYVELPFPAMQAALDQGRVDAAFMIEPFATRSLSTSRVIGQPFASIAPAFIQGAWFTTTAWADAHPAIVKRFADAMAETRDWAAKDTTKRAGILSKYTGVDVAVLEAIPRQNFAKSLTAALLQSTIDASAKYKVLSSSFSADDLIYKPRP
jgi:NitT/TauT family transport system substrate-binding protein